MCAHGILQSPNKSQFEVASHIFHMIMVVFMVIHDMALVTRVCLVI